MTAIDTTIETERAGISRSRNAPTREPSNVREISIGRQLRMTSRLFKNGSVPPALMNVRAIILVATAIRGSIRNWNISGTVVSEVLPVTTLVELVPFGQSCKLRCATTTSPRVDESALLLQS